MMSDADRRNRFQMAPAANDHSASFPAVRGAARSPPPARLAARWHRQPAADAVLSARPWRDGPILAGHRLRSPVSIARHKGDTASGRPVHGASTSRPTAGVWSGCSIQRGGAALPSVSQDRSGIVAPPASPAASSPASTGSPRPERGPGASVLYVPARRRPPPRPPKVCRLWC